MKEDDARADRKKNLELAFCQPVVDAINRLEGTDFAVHASYVEPKDAIFGSRSKRYPDRGVQVVTAPTELLNMRIDNLKHRKVWREFA